MLEKGKFAIRQAARRVIEPLVDEKAEGLRGELDRRAERALETLLDNPYRRSELGGRGETASAVFNNAHLTGKLMPFGGGASDRILLRATPGEGELPVPPEELWEGYASTAEEFLDGGRRDIDTMLAILADAGESPATLPRVLDFGCAAARMLRFYPAAGEGSERWGVDLNAKHITWCQQHLSPPMLFATTTTAPHLPFEDNTFDLVYCSSVFTHISDLADAWFLELRRVLRKGGYAFITIHDKHTLDLIFTRYKDHEGFAEFVEQLRRFEERTAIRTLDYAMFSMGSDPWSQVFYDRDDLVAKWSRLARVVSVTPEAFDPQTALLFQKRLT